MVIVIPSGWVDSGLDILGLFVPALQKSAGIGSEPSTTIPYPSMQSPTVADAYSSFVGVVEYGWIWYGRPAFAGSVGQLFPSLRVSRFFFSR